MFARLADLLILQPTRDPIETDGKGREWIETPKGKVEAWKTLTDDSHPPIDIVAIKFPGTGGRAERGGPHPFETWQNVNAEVWTINPIGYGGSEGVASMQNVASTCDAVWTHVRTVYPKLPIVLIGNSLGCVSALYLSARCEASGIFLRNPVPIHQLISQRPRYNWWNFGMAKLIANQVPDELDAVVNAKKSTCPAFFVRSEIDRVVPQDFQSQIVDNYSGPSDEFLLKDSDHDHPVPEDQVDDYVQHVRQMRSLWLPVNGNK